MANARIETELLNPIDSLATNAKKIAKLFSQIKNDEMMKIISDSLEDYNRPYRRIIISRKKQIEEKLKELGYDPQAANPTASLKPAKDIFKALTEEGGTVDNSFNTIFIRHIISSFSEFNPAVRLSEIECDRLRELTYVAIDMRLKKEEEINEQKVLFKLAEEKRLKEEEALLKTQLEKTKCENELTELDAIKSEKSAELVELELEKQERASQVSALLDKLQKYKLDEIEKQMQLDKTQQDLEEKKAAFEEIRKKHACTHDDFDYEGFSVKQLEECRESARQAFQQNVAVIKGRLKIADELGFLKGTRAKLMQEIGMAELDDSEFQEIRAARSKDMADLIKLRETEMTAEKLQKLKNELSLCLRLGQNKAAQTKIEEEKKRETSLQTDGYYAMVHSGSSADVTLQENYITPNMNDDYQGDENSQRKLEKKPKPKSFKEMTVKQGFSGHNKEVESAYDALNSFFGGKQVVRKRTLDEVKDQPSLKL